MTIPRVCSPHSVAFKVALCCLTNGLSTLLYKVDYIDRLRISRKRRNCDMPEYHNIPVSISSKKFSPRSFFCFSLSGNNLSILLFINA